MICTAAERDALMAAVQRFGNDCIGYERSTRIFGPTAAESIRAQVHVEKSRAAIRAMLAPDDAVKVPTDLFDRTREKLSQLAYFLDCGDDPIFVEAFGILDELAVLRGEATR